MELIEKILEEARIEARRIVEEAKREAKRALEEEEKRLKELEQKEIKEFKKLMEERKREEIAGAHLEGRRLIERAYEEKFEELISKLIEEFKRFRKTKEYEKWLKKLLERGLKELEDYNKEDFIVIVRKGDKKFIPKGFEVKETLDDLGGLVLEKKDGKIRANYSFSTLLENKREVIKIEFMKEMKRG